jgi:hypothetical protein
MIASRIRKDHQVEVVAGVEPWAVKACLVTSHMVKVTRVVLVLE